MARGINKVVLLGHVTADAKRINSEKVFGCNFNVAVNRRFRKAGGEWGDETAYVRCTYWNSQKVFDYLKQGRQVALDGHLVSNQFEGPDGKRVTLLEVNVDELILTDNKPRAYLESVAERLSESLDEERAKLAEREAEFERRVAALDATIPATSFQQAIPVAPSSVPLRRKSAPASSHGRSVAKRKGK